MLSSTVTQKHHQQAFEMVVSCCPWSGCEWYSCPPLLRQRGTKTSVCTASLRPSKVFGLKHRNFLVNRTTKLQNCHHYLYGNLPCLLTSFQNIFALITFLLVVWRGQDNPREWFHSNCIFPFPGGLCPFISTKLNHLINCCPLVTEKKKQKPPPKQTLWN